MIGDGDSDGDKVFNSSAWWLVMIVDGDGDGGDDVVDEKEDEDEEEWGAIRRNQCAGLPLSMTYAWLQVKSGKNGLNRQRYASAIVTYISFIIMLYTFQTWLE